MGRVLERPARAAESWSWGSKAAGGFCFLTRTWMRPQLDPPCWFITTGGVNMARAAAPEVSGGQLVSSTISSGGSSSPPITSCFRGEGAATRFPPPPPPGLIFPLTPAPPAASAAEK